MFKRAIVFRPILLLLSTADLKKLTKKNGWLFDWKYELRQPEREVYKLTIVNNLSVIQGLRSLEIKSDHIYMHPVESAPLIRAKQRYILVYPAILLPLHASFRVNEAFGEIFLLFQKLS